MSACDTCSSPGSCCSSFELNLFVDTDNWYDDAILKLNAHGLDFIKPIAKDPNWRYTSTSQTKLLYSCTRLADNGKCSDYENRPELCKVYQPKQDWLCCEYDRTFKGIKIIKR